MFNKGKPFCRIAVIDDSNLSCSSFEGMEKALLGFHSFVESRKDGMFTGGNGESGFTEDLTDAGVLFIFLRLLVFPDWWILGAIAAQEEKCFSVIQCF